MSASEKVKLSCFSGFILALLMVSNEAAIAEMAALNAAIASVTEKAAPRSGESLVIEGQASAAMAGVRAAVMAETPGDTDHPVRRIDAPTAKAQQITWAVRQLDRVIRQNAATARGSMSTAKELAGRSAESRSAISFLRIETAGSGPNSAIRARPARMAMARSAAKPTKPAPVPRALPIRRGAATTDGFALDICDGAKVDDALRGFPA